MRKLLLATLLLFPCLLQAQDTLRAQDSLHNARLDKQQLLVQQLSAERNADSLRRAALEQQVSRLSSADNLKKAALLRQLDSLRSKDSLTLARQQHQVDSLRRLAKGFTVHLLDDTLFTIYARQGSFTAQERAQAVQSRLEKIAGDELIDLKALRITSAEQTTDIVYQDELIISLADVDALWEHTDRQQLAARYLRQITGGIRHYQEETRWQTIAQEAGLALLAIAAVILMIVGINRGYNRLAGRIQRSENQWLKGIRIRNYELLNQERALRVLLLCLSAIRWLLILILVYVAIPVIFGIFPFTRRLSETLFGYVISPLRKIGLGIWDYVPNLITIIVLLLVFRYVLKFFHFLKTEIEQDKLRIPGFYADWANPTYQITRVLILAFMLIVIFPYLPGSESPVFKGVSVFMGVLFTFGSAGALGNVVAGLVLTYMRAFKLGDRVKIGEVTGDVIQKTLLVTRVRTIQNEIISIPNSTVMSNHTVNYSSEAQQAGLILHTTVTIGYDAPWRQIHELLISAARSTNLIEQEPAPYVLQTSLDDYYVSYQLNAYTRAAGKQAVIYSELHSHIQDKFNEAGVEIMSPHYRALRDGNTTAMPTDYLPKDYQAPGFHLSGSDRAKKDKD